MKIIAVMIRFLAVASLCPCLCFAQQVTADQPSDAEGILINRVLLDIQHGITQAQKTLDDQKMPLLQSVTLDLTTEVKISVGGKINLYIISFGRTVEKDRSQEIEIPLKPPSAKAPIQVANEPSLSDQLMKIMCCIGSASGQGARTNTKYEVAYSET